ncbi:hypothetical protein ThidrDRAFT_3797 [Thiorhodococcus drewsii AZ1]|uniref:Uncharacterized protein n=1 Tax=Thiorhodococcus drewsii AZ1 TaxID=765913 RepID=G2E684_9GAMM|nr:hypothetical protein [Thiorhodococcus drewsii]EGV28432.1 hypothetical protein ThidrDRAFT_3797 [Thiorhodococcus drewsii AZ1]
MATDVMLHIEEALDSETKQQLVARLAEQLGVSGETHHSEKPHLLFFPTDPVHAPPHRVLAAVREQGYQVQIVDL